MHILGISAFYHDSAACLVRDGSILAAAQEERFTRRKHDASFPKHSVAWCLDEAGISGNELDLVAFYDKPFLKFERILQTSLGYAPAGFSQFIKAVPLWMKEKIWTRDLLAKEICFDGPMIFPEHHESHAASAFFPSPYDEAAIVTLDGVGEWATSSWGTGQRNRIGICGEIHFPHSLGLLYSAFTYYTGFKVNSGEYKLMGLAPYGEPKYRDLVLRELIDLCDDGSFRLNLKYFNYCAGLTMTSQAFHDLFGGPPRKPESPLTQREMDLARSIQEVTEEVMLRIARYVHKETGLPHLCLAGGVALNCVGNGRILREGPFEGIWVQPAAGDAGGALGAALYAWHQYLGNKRDPDGVTDSQRGTLLGPSFSTDAVASYLEENRLPHTVLADDELASSVAALLAAGNVIGWFQGCMEFGPRALGARSILGDARSPDMQETMNLKIKFRESFRPFAPAVLAERVDEWFELDESSPYMLLVAPVRKDRRREMTPEEKTLFGLDQLHVVRSEIPAVTHVDYSARVQTVHAETNPRFHALLQAFETLTGCPVLINTSFNVRGEPIVCSPDDAYRCFMRTHMDYLVLGNYLLDKKQQPPWEEGDRWRVGMDMD